VQEVIAALHCCHITPAMATTTVTTTSAECAPVLFGRVLSNDRGIPTSATMLASTERAPDPVGRALGYSSPRCAHEVAVGCPSWTGSTAPSQVPTLTSSSDGESQTMPAVGRSRRFLALASAAHFLLNLSIIGQGSLIGAVHSAMVDQAGGSSNAEFCLLIAAGLGDVAGNLLTGWWMDRFPCHYLFAGSAFVSAVNLAIMPHVSGLWPMALCSALIMQGSGIGDCSFGAMIWVARECGVNNDGVYTGVKNLGTCLGLGLVMSLALATSTADDYRVLAYTWSSICAVAGFTIVALPSPSAPKEAAAARAAPGAPAEIARRETAIVCTGAVLSAIVVSIFIVALTLPANWIGTVASRKLLLMFLCVNFCGQFVMSPLMRGLPPAAVHVALLLTSALGCASAGAAFAVSLNGDGPGPNHGMLWLGYGIIGAALLTNFSVLFSFMSSLVNLSGARSSIIGLGAAVNPLICAVASRVSNPLVMWMGCAALLVIMAAMVIGLAVLGPVWLQKGKKNF